MLFLHETHDVLDGEGRAFEVAFRDEWMPRLADGEDARLLWFAWQAANDLPPSEEREDSWMRFALSLRDRYQSRLWRTTRWSPWY
jgi:hypothetical protein